MDPNPFETANAGFAQALYEDFLRDPNSVTPEWRRLFESGVVGEPPVAWGDGREVPVAPAPTGNGAAVATAPPVAPSTPAASAPALPAGAVLLKGPPARLVANMEESLQVPTATSFRELAVSVLEARRKQANDGFATQGRTGKVSFTHLIAWALVKAAMRHPAMGTVLVKHEGQPYRVPMTHVNLGLAVDVERKDGSRGLVVPVIKAAEAMDFAAFHAAYEDLVAKARDNKLMPDAYMGAVITLTNPGGIGTVASVPRLMAGQGTIIAVGAIGYPAEFATTPKDTLKSLGIAKVMTMTSTYDHRVIQGAESGEYLRTVDRLLQGEDGFYEEVFASLGLAAPGATTAAAVADRAPARDDSRPATRDRGVAAVGGTEALQHVAAAMSLVKAFRTHGHLAARLDPLGSEPIGDPALDPNELGLTPEIMASIPASVLRVYVPGETLADALPHLQATYCGTIAYEVEHIASHEERVWLREAIESGAYRQPLTPEERQALLQRLTEVETFERFLHKAYLGQKRFSIEGVDLLVPMLDLTTELAAGQGARHVVIGMAHRGRLNVLVHNVGRPYETILGEFEGHKAHPEEPDAGTGDVKYHLGADGVVRTRSGKTIAVTLAHNPSHLEFVGPVVDGRARAEQTSRKSPRAEHDPTAALPVLIHGDAAFAGQGVVAETFNLGSLAGYGTGGTLHLITNNQVGFTTDMRDARSTRYASDLAKGFDIPIIHVNADDPEACLSAVRLAMAYRERFRGDVLIDLVGYRRWGHNEGDEPGYTQPVMYARIKELPTVRAQYAARLAAEGIVTEAEAGAAAERTYQRLVEIQQAVKTAAAPREKAEVVPSTGGGWTPGIETALGAEVLTDLNQKLLAWPAGFTVHPKLVRQLERRREALGQERAIDWGHAEALAYGSLLLEGTPIRLTGQDTERGTFSHRHAVLHDAKTGASWSPFQHLPGATAPFEIHNSPLSELATMGFEYGYSVAAPEALVLWEAQFGDFVNGAQVIIDQFLSAGQSKWGITSRLTLLLPHGYEGQGPEHSSARLERFLQLSAEGNFRVANCTTPAQFFHLVRRQARDPRRRPLIVLTPKSLLRLPAAASSLAELTGGRFRAVLDDPAAIESPRVLVCSGKVYYDLLAEAEKRERRPALVRLEQLYPFPTEEVQEVLANHAKAREVVWVQEEPRNQGAWGYVRERLQAVLPAGMTLSYVGRPERASTAEGYPAAHAKEQARIVAEALG